jgi:hypothetical protein
MRASYVLFIRRTVLALLGCCLIVAPVAAAPVLANVAVPFGTLTQKGNGGVPLNSFDNGKYGAAWKGLNMWNGVGGAPASWTIQDTTATAGYTPGSHWSVDGGVTCMGAGAVAAKSPITPVPCAAGVTAGLSKGDYSFQIVAMDATGAASNAATLTYNMVPCALNVGETATVTNGVAAWSMNAKVFPTNYASAPSLVACPAGFGKAPGHQILVSVGVDAPTFDGTVILQNQTYGYAAGTPNVPNVTLTWADPARKGALAALAIYNINSMTVLNLVLTTGDGLNASSPKQFLINQAGVGCTSTCFFVKGVSIRNVNSPKGRGRVTGYAIGCSQYTETDAMVINNSWTAFNDLGGCPNITNPVTNTNNVMNDLHIRYFTANAVFFGASVGWTFNDTWVLSPLRESATHVDSGQFYDVVQTQNLTVHRTIVVQADGTAMVQGTPFEGRAGNDYGWIDDGSAGPAASSGKAGTVLHIAAKGPNGLDLQLVPTVLQAWPKGQNGATNLLTDGTTLISVCNSGPTPTTCNIDAGHPQLLGSPTNLMEFMSAPNCNNNFDGVVYMSGTTNGVTIRSDCGTSSFKHFTLVKSNGYQHGASLYNNFQGQIANVACTNPNTNNVCSLLTITGAFSGPNGIYATGAPTTHILYPQGCNLVATWYQPYSTVTCTYDVNVALSGKTYGLNPTGYPNNTNGGTSGQFILDTGRAPPATGTVGYSATTDTPDDSGPVFQVRESDVPLQHTGTMLVSSGAIWDKINLEGHDGNVSPTTPLPPGWTLSHVHLGCRSAQVISPANFDTRCSAAGAIGGGSADMAHAGAVAAFDGANCGAAVDQGGCDPKVYFTITPSSHWAALSSAAVVQEVWKLIKPRAGGPLDNGDGTFDGAENGAGQWNDGSGKTP